jgi:hypothetical protein
VGTKLTKKAQADRDEARETLRDIMSKTERDRHGNPVIYTVLRHVSASGMSRDISLLVTDSDGGGLRNITHLAARALSENPKDRNGQWVIRVGGCGMDMGFHLVYSLSHALYEGQDRAGYIIRHEWV